MFICKAENPAACSFLPLNNSEFFRFQPCFFAYLCYSTIRLESLSAIRISSGLKEVAMKQTRKLIALLLAMIMMFCLTGCDGLFGVKMTRAALKMQKLQSLRSDITSDLSLNVTLMGEGLDLDMTASGTVDVILSPLLVKADLTLNMLDENVDTLSYLEQKGDKLLIYSSADEGETWSRTEVDASSLAENGKMDTKSLTQLAKLANSFEEVGTEMVKGSEATIYSGKITGADLASSGDLDAVVDSIGDGTGSGIDLSALDFSNVGDIPLTVGIDKESGMVVKCGIDLTSLMQAVLPVALDAAMKTAMADGALGEMGGLGLDALGLQLNLNKLTADAELYDFDAVSEIVIPDAALNAVDIAA